MIEMDLIVNQLTAAEKWIYDNTQLITDKVLWSRDGKGIITSDAYDESLEEEIIRLLRFMPKIASVEKVEGGIQIIAK